eukprot:6888043-Pyramimonas_sp.AAC.1
MTRQDPPPNNTYLRLLFARVTRKGDVVTRGPRARRYILPPLLRLVLALGIYCLPSRDWFARWVYTASPPAIGSHAGYILPPLMRVVRTLGTYCLPSCDWFSRWVYSPSPPAIGSHARGTAT